MSFLMREADQCAIDRSHTLGNEFLSGSATSALPRVTTFLCATKFFADAMTARARFEHYEVAIDQVFSANDGRGAIHGGHPNKREPR